MDQDQDQGSNSSPRRSRRKRAAKQTNVCPRCGYPAAVMTFHVRNALHCRLCMLPVYLCHCTPRANDGK